MKKKIIDKQNLLPINVHTNSGADVIVK